MMHVRVVRLPAHWLCVPMPTFAFEMSVLSIRGCPNHCAAGGCAYHLLGRWQQDRRCCQPRLQLALLHLRIVVLAALGCLTGKSTGAAQTSVQSAFHVVCYSPTVRLLAVAAGCVTHQRATREGYL
jgi:hypothetical protein